MEKEFKKYYLLSFEHDNISCNALKEYHFTVDGVKDKPKHMREIADRYRTTTEEMKRHWHCI